MRPVRSTVVQPAGRAEEGYVYRSQLCTTVLVAHIYSEPGVAGSAVIVDGYSAGLLLPSAARAVVCTVTVTRRAAAERLLFTDLSFVVREEHRSCAEIVRLVRAAP